MKAIVGKSTDLLFLIILAVSLLSLNSCAIPVLEPRSAAITSLQQGETFLSQGKLAEAEASFEKAVDLTSVPEHKSLLLLRLSEILVNAGRLNEARIKMKEAIAIMNGLPSSKLLSKLQPVGGRDKGSG